MAFYRSFKDSKGNYITTEWTLKDYAYVKILSFSAVIIFIGIITVVVPTLWLLIYFISIEKQRLAISITAIIACIYFLLDYHFGWMCWSLLHFILGENGLLMLASYQTGLLVSHLTLLFFSKKLYFLLEQNNKGISEKTKTLALFAYSLVFIWVGYKFSIILLPNLISQYIPEVITN